MVRKLLRSSVQNLNANVEKVKDNNEDLCVICGENISNKEDSFPLKCSNCQRIHHASCLKFNQQQYDIATTYFWLCHKCKICALCHKPKNAKGGTLIICDKCDRAYHEKCFDPPVKWSKKYWTCILCQNPKVEVSPVYAVNNNQPIKKNEEKELDLSSMKVLDSTKLKHESSPGTPPIKRQCVIKHGGHYFPSPKKRTRPRAVGNKGPVTMATAVAANRILRRARRNHSNASPVTCRGESGEKLKVAHSVDFGEKASSGRRIRTSARLLDYRAEKNHGDGDSLTSRGTQKTEDLDVELISAKEEPFLEGTEDGPGEGFGVTAPYEEPYIRVSSPKRLTKSASFDDSGPAQHPDLERFTEAIVFGRLFDIREARSTITSSLPPHQKGVSPPPSVPPSTLPSLRGRRKGGRGRSRVSKGRAPSPPPPSEVSCPASNDSQTCPFPGCDSSGHLSGALPNHFTLAACPAFHGTTSEACLWRWGGRIVPLINRLHHPDFKDFTPVKTEPAEDLALKNVGPEAPIPSEPTSRRTTKSTHISPKKASPGPKKGLAVLAGPAQTYYTAEEYKPDLDDVPGEVRVRHGSAFAKYQKTRQPLLEGLAPDHPDTQIFLDTQAILSLVQESDLEPFAPPSVIKQVCFGTVWQMDAWYPSPFPSEKFGRSDTIYFCEFCLSYYESQIPYLRHLSKCTLKFPPGDEIYRQGPISIFEVDGRASKSYCRNLCLLSKLFMESKTLCYEVEHFWFYVMTVADRYGHCHLVGYFSKEKQNFQKNTVSCILILPHFMRKGYGWILIDFSYLLARIEDKIGSPERPLSDHGLVTYRSYWKSIILNYFSRCDDDKLSIRDLSQESGIHPDDIVSTLQYFRLLKSWRGNHIILKKDLEEVKQSSKKNWRQLPGRVEEKYLVWKPHN